MYCRYCGEQIEEGKNYCKACGKPIEDNSSVAEKLDKIEYVIGLLVICIGIKSPILCIILWVLNRKKYPVIAYKATIGIALGILVSCIRLLPILASPTGFVILIATLINSLAP